MAEKKRPLIEMDTRFDNIPKIWLDVVEPRITRPKKSTCWIWEGACDKDGEPVVNFNNPTTGKRNTRMVKRLVADLFWVVKRGMEVLHHCGTRKCLNPAHFFISSKHHTQEDRTAMVRVRQRRLLRYVEKGT